MKSLRTKSAIMITKHTYIHMYVFTNNDLYLAVYMHKSFILTTNSISHLRIYIYLAHTIIMCVLNKYV